METKIIELTFKVKGGLFEERILRDITSEIQESDLINIQNILDVSSQEFIDILKNIMETVEGKLFVLNEYYYKQNKIYKFYVIFKNLNIYFFMSMEDNILKDIYIQDTLQIKKIQQSLNEYLNIMELSHLRNKVVSELENVEQQIISIIKFLMEQEVILDKTVNSLDGNIIKELRESMKTLNNLEKIKIIIISLHDILNANKNNQKIIGFIIT